MAAALAMTTSVAIADDVEDAHRQAISGRDSYWNCLAQEYTRDGNKGMSEQDFTVHIASVCPYRAAEFPGYAVGLSDDAISGCRGGRPYDDRQQRDRLGAKRYRDGIRQTQSSAEVAGCPVCRDLT